MFGIVAVTAPAQTLAAPVSAPVRSAPKFTPAVVSKPQVKALYDYTAASASEVSFSVGTVMNIVKEPVGCVAVACCALAAYGTQPFDS